MPFSSALFYTSVKNMICVIFFSLYYNSGSEWKKVKIWLKNAMEYFASFNAPLLLPLIHMDSWNHRNFFLLCFWNFYIICLSKNKNIWICVVIHLLNNNITGVLYSSTLNSFSSPSLQGTNSFIIATLLIYAPFILSKRFHEIRILDYLVLPK